MSGFEIEEYVDSVWIMATGERPERAFSRDLESIKTYLEKFKAEIENQAIERTKAACSRAVGSCEYVDHYDVNNNLVSTTVDMAEAIEAIKDAEVN